MPSEAYRAWVYRLWKHLEVKTGRAPHYMAMGRLACYCPCCLIGTVSIQLLQRPQAGATFISAVTGASGCSFGCTEAQIADALFA